MGIDHEFQAQSFYLTQIKMANLATLVFQLQTLGRLLYKRIIIPDSITNNLLLTFTI
jgi:hypothetical protein